MKKFSLALFVCLWVAHGEVFAQDPQWTQFYANPLYHNPAYAGIHHGGRASLNYRNQWAALSNAFVTYAASYDHYFKRANSGAGANVVYDVAGEAGVRSMMIAASYAYELKVTRNWRVRGGLNMAYNQRGVDESRFIFRDQLEDGGVTRNTTSNLVNSVETSRFIDVGVGGMVYSRNLWFGVSGFHLNRPNQSVGDQSTSTLPIRGVFEAGYSINLSRNPYGSTYNTDVVDRFLKPVIQYRFQGKFDQLDLGAYLIMEPLIVGLFYRGLPYLKSENEALINHDAIAVLVGGKIKDFRLGYSYDITISGLSGQTGGSHEVSFIYEFDTPAPKRRYQPIPCPKI